MDKNYDPQWLAKKMRKSAFAPNKNKPGVDYPAIAYTEPEVENPTPEIND